MNLFAWIAFGLISGVVANILDPEEAHGGVLGAILLGVLGAMLGGFLANLIFGINITGFNLSSLAVAVGGALLLLFLGRALKGAP